MRLVSAREYELMDQLSKETLKLRRRIAELSMELEAKTAQLREVEMTLERQRG